MHYEFFVLLTIIFVLFLFRSANIDEDNLSTKEVMMRSLGMLKAKRHKVEMFLAPYLVFVG